MKKYLQLCWVSSKLVSVSQSQINYPQTKKTDKVDSYFATKVTDPYRWLEDDCSLETADWVKAQNQVTFGYSSTIPYRNTIKSANEKIREL